ncbi:MAG: (2Fe-2S)-binding protein [Acidimicrobiales bacterium]
MTNRTHVHCTINGDEVDFLTTDGESLLNALRDEVGLTGAKEGCGTGDCGACSIMLDGVLTCSCLVFAPEAEGATIVTVEGLAQGDHLSPLQNAFLEGAALQCGICTPGFLVAAQALLDKNPDPTETEVRYALAGNLCRCTGYDKIVRSVLDAAAIARQDDQTGASA